MMSTTNQAYRAQISRFDKAPMRNGLDGWWINFRCTAPEGFFDAKEAVKALPTAYRRWDDAAPGRPAWWVATFAMPDLARIITGLEVYRPLWSRVGSGPRYDAPPPRQRAIPADVEAAFTTLGLLPTAPKRLVEAARKVWATIHHPDAGGDLATMKAINTAADTAVAWAERHQQRAA